MSRSPGSQQQAWFLRARNALSGASNGGRPRFPNLKALVYFDSDPTGESGCAWHVDSSAAAVVGFRALGADPWFALPDKR